MAEKGKDGFYKGRIAQAIVDLVQSKGGLMTLDDLASHESTPTVPVSYTYGDKITVHEVYHSSYVLYLHSWIQGSVHRTGKDS